MMVRKIVLLLCLGVLVIGLPVLAQDETEEPHMLPDWTCPADVVGSVPTAIWYNWTTYEADTTRSDFEKLCGMDDGGMGEDNFGSNEDLIARLRQGNPGYDVIVPTGTFVPQMIRENMLEPLDLSKIPNIANVSDFLLDPAYDPGNQYTVPYQWGTIGIGYNVEAVGHEITSWDDVWNYPQKRVAWILDPRAMLGIALHLLGYDANTTNPDEISAAGDFLVEHGGNVSTVAADDGQEKLLQGEVDIAIEYSGDIFQIMSDCDTNEESNCAGEFNFVLPNEGTVRWVDNLAIPADAPHVDLALAFLDYILDPQVGADISNYTAYASPDQAAIDQKLIDPELLLNPIIYPTPEVSATLFDIVDVGDEAARSYNEVWQQVTPFLGG